MPSIETPNRPPVTSMRVLLPPPAYMNAIAPTPASIGSMVNIPPMPLGICSGSSGGDSSRISPRGRDGPA
jgi:hypothetical protein